MSLWNSEVGQITGDAQEAFIHIFKQIPDGTRALAKINKFVNTTYKDKYSQQLPCLEIEWLLIEGNFKGQKVKQKLKVFDNDANSKHRSLNMLMLLCRHFSVQPERIDPPSDQALVSFLGKVGGIVIGETDPWPDGRQFNYVTEVHLPAGFVSETGVKKIIERVPISMAQTGKNPHFGLLDCVTSETELGDSAMNNDIPFLDDVPF